VCGFWGQVKRKELFSRIPEDTDILITHGPPQGILDQSALEGKHQGCDQLLTAVRRVRPRVHVFGHIHQHYGVVRSAGTLFVNAALAGSDYTIAKSPIEFQIVIMGAE
jgi:Icc-related predicted phosphoesterase